MEPLGIFSIAIVIFSTLFFIWKNREIRNQRIKKMKLRIADLKKLSVGDKIKIISCPRSDGADAYAGIEGIIEEIELKQKYRNGIGSINLKLENGWFCSTGIVNKLKAEKLS